MDYSPPILSSYEIAPISIIKPAEQPPTPILYTIQLGETLTSIAELHSTSVDRLWAANPELTDPNQITPDKPLKIPQEGEELAPRPYPGIIEAVGTRTPMDTDKPLSRGFSVSGNTYTPGQCTWGVKNWRPDIPNGWGNASAWLSNARRQGWATGSTPVVGAVGWTSGHVVLVVGVDNDTVTIKEMNYNWTPYSVRTIDRPASKYVYIYN